MVYSEIEFQNIKNIKDVTLSSKNIVFCTGKRVLIYDKKWQLIHELDNLKYIYKAVFSPDEKKVLLISNQNHFIVVNLDPFLVTKKTIVGKYNGPLSGLGCWGKDSNSIYVCPSRNDNCLSVLRIYDLKDWNLYQDRLVDKYCLTSISFIPQLNKYFLTGFNYENHGNYIIWLNDDFFEEYRIQNFNDCISHAIYDVNQNCCIIHGLEQTILCDYNGRIQQRLTLRDSITTSFSDIFLNFALENNTIAAITFFSNILALENTSINDSINCLILSKNKKYVYIGSNKSFFVLNASSQNLELKIPVEYGVHKIIELTSKTILLITWNGAKIFNFEEN